MGNEKNRLKKIRVSEISLVDKASVGVPGLDKGKNFLIFKRDNDGDPESCMFEGIDLMQVKKPGDRDYETWKRGREEVGKQAQELLDVLGQLETAQSRSQNKVKKNDGNDELAGILLIEKALIQLKLDDPEQFRELEDNPDAFEFEETPSGFKITKKVHKKPFRRGPVIPDASSL